MTKPDLVTVVCLGDCWTIIADRPYGPKAEQSAERSDVRTSHEEDGRKADVLVILM